MEVKIIFEDEFFLAVDKPSGLVVHGDGRTVEETLVGWVEEYFEKMGGGVAAAQIQKNIGNPHTLDSGRYTERWGIVNRLDRETSGVILIAKDQESFLNLQKQFVDRTVVKEYLAVVWGTFEEGKIKITEPISRHKKDPRFWVCGTGVGERITKRDAETEIEFIPPYRPGGKSLVKLIPKTGRTHQLRLHTRFVGHPIVGDTKYGINGITNEHSTQQIDNILKNVNSNVLDEEKKSRLMLHAVSLEFLHPKTFKKIKIETESSF